MRKVLVLSVLILCSVRGFGQIIADHRVVDKYNQIPQQYIDEVKKMWLVYAGESHSEAIRYGLNALESLDSKFAVSIKESGTPEAATSANLRSSRGTWGDINNAEGWIYHYGEEDWCTYADYPAYTYNPDAVARTKAGIAYCNTNNLTIGAMAFGHCYDDGKNLAFSYIRATKEYIAFCRDNGYATKIFFTTGPVDGYMASGSSGYDQYLKWQIIRDSVNNDATRYFFDYADILSYNNSGELKTATYDGHTFPVIHPDNEGGAYTGHIGSVGAIRLAKAMWWLLARMQGWNGGTTAIDDTEKGQSSSQLVYSKDKIEVELDESFHFQKARINDMQGKLLSDFLIQGNHCSIDTSHFAPGIYFLTLINPDRSETHKMIIR